jgi:hypothetical protein
MRKYANEAFQFWRALFFKSNQHFTFNNHLFPLYAITPPQAHAQGFSGVAASIGANFQHLFFHQQLFARIFIV